MRIRIMTLSAALVAAATPARASDFTREQSMGIIFWIFLGICAVIVATLVVPAVLKVLGAGRDMAMALREPSKEEPEGE